MKTPVPEPAPAWGTPSPPARSAERPYPSSYPPPFPPPYPPSDPPPHHAPSPAAAVVVAPWISARFWRRPAPGADAARAGVLVGATGVGLLAAVTLPGPAGLQWPLLGLLVLAVTRGAVRAGRRRSPGAERVLPTLAIALTAVMALRASSVTAALCLVAAVGLGALSAVGGRGWLSLWLAPAALAVLGGRALPWAWRGLRRTHVLAPSASWVRGATAAVVLVWVCGALLVSADGAFAGLLAQGTPDVELRTVPWRLVLGAVAAVLTLAMAHAALAPPRWRTVQVGRRARPAAEWLLPVLALDALLALFLAVQTAVLFGAYPDSLVLGDATPAERARQGFGQLVVLTLVVAALLGWAARCSDPDRARHRRLLAAGGGTLLALVLVVVASALRRLWLYEEAFGWTVLRLHVGVFETWLGLAVLLAAVAWAMRRTADVPRLVAGSAGVAMLVLGLAGPDAVVARGNVARFERTGDIDLAYAERLSDDAVPALARLPEPQRTCALATRDVREDPWFAVNLSRVRARAVLRSLGDLPVTRPATCPAAPTATSS